MYKRQDVDNVRLSFEQLKNINTPEVVADVREQIQVFYEDAERQMNIIEKRYLGDDSDAVSYTHLDVYKRQQTVLRSAQYRADN